MQSPTIIRYRADEDGFTVVTTLLSHTGIHAHLQRYGITARGTTLLRHSEYFSDEGAAVAAFNERSQ